MSNLTYTNVKYDVPDVKFDVPDAKFDVPDVKFDVFLRLKSKKKRLFGINPKTCVVEQLI